MKEFGGRREDQVIATKVFNPDEQDAPNDRGLSRKHIMAAIDASLKRLGVDYVDLYQIHRFDSAYADRGKQVDALNDVGARGARRCI